ncbi:GPO family capsid scaffolding protein [Lysobacter cavernae]|uniref:GPO family capsid scaffolding protein n=1 Tax=Lysobacter cavernae TaxID=1685901 RepID=A0ABV7RLI6_9GAMM
MSAKTKKFRSKWFRVAVEGSTSDGRKIERTWLSQIAQTYNPLKYGARIFVEHIRGLNPEWGFRCMGDVLAVKTDTVQIDGKDHLALFAQIQPTDEMVAMNKAGQKIYSSIEVDPDFAGKGEAYLVGLGVTDSPASLGTEMLAFASQNPDASPLKARKQSPQNLFSVALESDIEFEEIEDKPGVIDALFSRLDALLKPKPEETAPPSTPAASDFSKIGEAVTAVAEHVRQQDQRFTAAERENTELKAQLQKLSTDFAALKSQLEGTASHGQVPRPPATGNNKAELTDC